MKNVIARLLLTVIDRQICLLYNRILHPYISSYIFYDPNTNFILQTVMNGDGPFCVEAVIN